MKRTIAINGIKGCNHHIAAINFFQDKDVETENFDKFADLAKEVATNPQKIGLMAIENTIAGSILENYRLIREYKLRIVGEYKLRIKHALVALPGTKIEDVKEVDSHPMALLQCQKFLGTLPGIKEVQKDDTAGAALWIKEHDKKDHAAICPAHAAEIYGMEVLAEGIETNKHNFTRFFVLASPENEQQVIKEIYGEEDYKKIVNKSSIVFTLTHEAGSLSAILSILSFYRMNLTHIQSIPIVGREWEYQFFINVSFEDYERYTQAVNAIRPLTSEIEILGEFPEGGYDEVQ